MALLKMSIQDNLNKRLAYMGGNAEGRLQKGKLKSLKKALLYSYQAATAVLQDGRKFRCLMNPSKLKADYTTNIISIPYEDICLGIYNEDAEELETTTSKDIEHIGMKPGDVFMWLETNTHWLVTLEHLEEDAYFRAEVNRCDNQIEIDGELFWVAIKGPNELSLEWKIKNNTIINSLNYDLVLYVTKNETTSSFFHRHQKMKIDGNNWVVAGVNSYYGEGVIEVFLEEAFNNSIADAVAAEQENQLQKPSAIVGPNTLNPYDKATYTIPIKGGVWKTDFNRISLTQDDNTVTLEVLYGKSGKFNLYYYVDNVLYEEKEIIIKSL